MAFLPQKSHIHAIRAKNERGNTIPLPSAETRTVVFLKRILFRYISKCIYFSAVLDCLLC